MELFLDISTVQRLRQNEDTDALPRGSHNLGITTNDRKHTRSLRAGKVYSEGRRAGRGAIAQALFFSLECSKQEM